VEPSDGGAVRQAEFIFVPTPAGFKPDEDEVILRNPPPAIRPAVAFEMVTLSLSS